ncbi:hypothetical protein OO306_03195, partial [Pseudomonas sp. DCB_AW]|uniref:hypothetical protein n=1 Tax=Pseudomonas sp. DCB_AW TaxID=2993596 RepID=UPI00224930B4
GLRSGPSNLWGLLKSWGCCAALSRRKAAPTGHVFYSDFRTSIGKPVRFFGKIPDNLRQA